MKHRILLIEDDNKLRRILQLVLRGAGYDVPAAADGHEGAALWQKTSPDVVVTDLKMAPGDGLFVLAYGRSHDPETPIILLTAYGTVETAVLAMKDGAFDYLTKPVDNNELLKTVADALSSRPDPTAEAQKVVGTSAVMESVLHSITIFAATDSAVVISGESGTGKELAARAIHKASKHPDGPFIRINCAAIPADLLESELFGHLQGAFTGAVASREGAFILANGGTIFLDEIGDLPLALQPKLLHAVEEKTITPVGSNIPRAVKVKILSATNRDLARMVAEKTFRQDLYFRLNGLHLHMPAVRDRQGDLSLLLDYFRQLFCRRLKKKIRFSRESIGLLQEYPWPGNVREIKNVIERAVLTSNGQEIMPADLPSSIQVKAEDLPRSTDLNDREQQFIAAVLQECDWNQSEAARRLGISRNTLRYRMKKYGLKKTSVQ